MRSRQQRIIGRLRRENTQIAAIRFPEALDTQAMKKALPKDCVMLYFYISPVNVGVFSDSGDAEADFQRGRALFYQLIQPVRTQVAKAQRLLIITDGPLNELPFGALIISGTRENPVYLSDKKFLHTAASMTVYAELQARKPAQRGPSPTVMTLGDPAYPPVKKAAASKATKKTPSATQVAMTVLAPKPGAATESESRTAHLRTLADERLTWTRNEVRALRLLFSGVPLLDEKSTEAAVRQASANADLLHFGCHGLLDNKDPLASGLKLLPGGEDGYLQAWELYSGKWKLHADLVTLAACETGLGGALGRFRSSGAMSRARAFHYAGARCVLYSLWKVQERSTSQLMEFYYANLKAGQTKDAALFHAIERLRKQPRTRHPDHWAGFQLSGDPRPITTPKDGNDTLR